MAPLYNDLLSLLPSFSSPTVSPVPDIGSTAPVIPGEDEHLGSPTSTIIMFARHCGCPFAENEVRELGQLSAKHPELRCIVVAHSKEEVAKEWFERVGGKEAGTLKLVADPEKKYYAAYGIGQLPFFGLFSRPMLSELSRLKSEGIINTPTGEGSARWQNSGAFALDEKSKVVWSHVAVHAGDMSNFEEAVGKLGF